MHKRGGSDEADRHALLAGGQAQPERYMCFASTIAGKGRGGLKSKTAIFLGRYFCQNHLRGAGASVSYQRVGFVQAGAQVRNGFLLAFELLSKHFRFKR